MPLTIAEAVADVVPVLSFIQAAEAAVSAVPKENPKPSDFIKCANAILAAAAPLADQIAEQVKS